MNPFFFGSSQRPLFGVYSHGKPTGEGGAVLLCYPIGSEYMRAHRAFRQLNALLNRAGMSVVRFDYSCTGDSWGDGLDADAEAWVSDVDWAIDELKDNAMVDSVCVVGLRWGGTVATIACQDREDVEHLLLWDPVVRPSAYLDQHVGTPRPSQVIGVQGFPFSPSLVSGLDAIDLLEALRKGSGPELSVLVSEDRADYRELEEWLRARGRSEHWEVVPSSGNWAQADPFGDALVPQRIIQAIVDRLKTVRSRNVRARS